MDTYILFCKYKHGLNKAIPCHDHNYYNLKRNYTQHDAEMQIPKPTCERHKRIAMPHKPLMQYDCKSICTGTIGKYNLCV